MNRLTGTIARIVGYFHAVAGSSDMKTIRIRAVLFHEAGWWCAQCLEYDIATQAQTIPELKKELERALTIHVELSTERGQEPFALLPKAPERYFQMYDAFEKANGTEEGIPIKALYQNAATCILARFASPQMALN
jgi:predicted RNase H-like HicB family nuclease